MGVSCPSSNLNCFGGTGLQLEGKKNQRNHSIVHCGSSKCHGSPDVRGEESSVPIFTETAQFSQVAKLSERFLCSAAFSPECIRHAHTPRAYATRIRHTHTSQWSVTLVSFCSMRCVSHRLSKAGPKSSTHFHQHQKQNKKPNPAGFCKHALCYLMFLNKRELLRERQNSLCWASQDFSVPSVLNLLKAEHTTISSKMSLLLAPLTPHRLYSTWVRTHHYQSACSR